jgi:hypothetical protein
MVEKNSEIQHLKQKDTERSKEIETLKQKDAEKTKEIETLKQIDAEKTRTIAELKKEQNDNLKKFRQEVSSLKEEMKGMKEQMNIGSKQATTSGCASGVDMKDVTKKCPNVAVALGKKFNLEFHVGRPKDVTITNDNVVEFKGDYYSTVAAPHAVVKGGEKLYYEVTFKEKVTYCFSYIGWATNDFKRYHKDGYAVGQCPHSWSFGAQYGDKWHNKNRTRWGKMVTKDGGEQVLGVGIDMHNGRMLYGWNGVWTSPMGVAFDHINTNLEVFPAISGACSIKLSVNFGDQPFIFPGPDPSYKKLIEL